MPSFPFVIISMACKAFFFFFVRHAWRELFVTGSIFFFFFWFAGSAI